MIVPVSEQRRGRQVRIEPVEYANGWAANVEIDGIVLQTDSDAVALCVTREEAIAQGEQRAREFLQQH